jgi:hypothetical protein
MTQTIRAHFDGKAIIPDEPVSLRPGEEVTVQINSVPQSPNGAPTPEVIQERLRRIDEFYGRPLLGNLPPEALRRESIYDDRA